MHYAAIIDYLKTAIIVLDKDEVICHINSAAQQFFNMSQQRAIGKKFSNLFIDLEHYTEVQQTIQSANTNAAPFTQHQIRATLYNQEKHHFDLSVTPIAEAEQLLIEIFDENRILRIKTEKQFYQTQASAKQLIRNLAHEIKNPLAGLRGAAQLLESEINDTQLLNNINIILSETDRLTEVVDNLLLPHRKSNFSLLNIHEITERISGLLNAEIEAQNLNINIKKDYDPSIPLLIADKTQLIQALLNIASNALHAMQKNGKGQILFRTSVQRKFTIDDFCHKLVCKIDIIDNGPGIDQSLHDSLFLPLISGEQQGTGLGLPIAQSIIHHHQGLITFQSNPGNTCFSIYLPIKTDKINI